VQVFSATVFDGQATEATVYGVEEFSVYRVNVTAVYSGNLGTQSAEMNDVSTLATGECMHLM
jgi:hypothetical protein